MRVFKKHFIGLFIISLIVFIPTPAQAQAPERLTVLQANTTPGKTGLMLDIIFTMTDGAGHAALGAEVEQATIQLPGGAATSLSVAPATSPHYMVLLLDTNARIREKLDTVLNAAQAAFDQISPNTYVAVVQFGVETQLLTDFTNDVAQIRRGLDNVTYYPMGSTSCIYNALHQATELLGKKVSHPAERGSIILFTDGNDELKHLSDHCAPRTHDEFMEMAVTSNSLAMPIYTVGLCLDTPCTNLNLSELGDLAIETSGFTFTGREADMHIGFNRVMERIRAQWTAHGEIPVVGRGEHTANLAVKLRNLEATLQSQVSFLSAQDVETNTSRPSPTSEPDDEISPPTPTPSVMQDIPRLKINSFRYDSSRDVYVLSLSIANPQLVPQLAVKIENDGGLLVTDIREGVNQRPTLEIEIDAADFQAGQGYIIIATAHDQSGNLIEIDGTPVEVSKEFKLPPPKPPPHKFDIRWVNANLETNQLIVDLDIVAPEIEFDYQGFILNGAGQSVAEIGPTPVTGPRLQLPLPASLQDSTQEQTFEMTLYLINTKENERLDPQTYEFTVTPLPTPTLWQRLGKTVLIPFVSVAILIILLGTLGWFLLRPRQKINTPEIYGPAADQLPPMAQ